MLSFKTRWSALSDDRDVEPMLRADLLQLLAVVSRDNSMAGILKDEFPGLH